MKSFPLLPFPEAALALALHRRPAEFLQPAPLRVAGQIWGFRVALRCGYRVSG